MSEYPSAECKSVEFHPCDSRVGKLAVICGADTFSFTISKFSSVVPLFIIVEFSYSFLPEFITDYHYLAYFHLILDNHLIIYPLLYLLAEYDLSYSP
jgi:hypothetical protein